MKLTKILVTAVVLLCFSFTCIGYAALTDELTITGAVTVEAPPKVIDYLHVSGATIQSATSNDSVGEMDGSSDLTNQFGWVVLNLDFTSATEKTVALELTNLSSARLAYYKTEYSVTDGTDSIDSISVSGLTVDEDGDGDHLNGGYNPTEKLVGVLDETKLENTNEYVIQQGATYTGASVTLTSSAARVVQLTVKVYYGAPTNADRTNLENDATLNAAIGRLVTSLNDPTEDSNGDTLFDRMEDVMGENGVLGWLLHNGDYVGNVVGAGGESDDNALIDEIFGETLNAVVFGDDKPQECTVMLKKENVDGVSGNEIVLYMTTVDTSKYDDGTTRPNGSEIPVYAVVMKLNSENKWEQYGQVYKGTATTNAYTGGSGNTSFHTGTWRADGDQTFVTVESDGSRKTYTVADNATISTCMTRYKNRTAVSN